MWGLRFSVHDVVKFAVTKSMSKTPLSKKSSMAAALTLCVSAIIIFGIYHEVNSQEWVIASTVMYGNSNCRMITDKSGEEKPCSSTTLSGSFTEMTKGEAISKGLLYVSAGIDKSASIRKLANTVDATVWAYEAQLALTPRPRETWVVVNGRFEVGDEPLKPNYITDTIVFTEARAKEYGFTTYVPITTTFEDAHDKLMRVLESPPKPS